jgi:stringent starvation protein B
MNIVSTKPYLIRAIYEWCIDQGYTPHIAVVIDTEVKVPPGYAQNGQIVLNLGPDATSDLLMGNEFITFQARFGGAAHALRIPVSHVLAVYARENGHGMAFEPEGPQDVSADDEAEILSETDGALPTDQDPDEPPPRRGHLKVIK